MARQVTVPPQQVDQSMADDVPPALTIDRIVHEPARLVILAVLHSVAEADFKFLEAATRLSKGNLSRQASKLEDAGYIAIRKYYKGKVPATSYQITVAGKAAFAAYWAKMNTLQQNAQPGS